VNIGTIKPTLTRFGPFDNPAKIASYSVPGVTSFHDYEGFITGRPYEAEVDGYSDPPTIWMVGRKPVFTTAEVNWHGVAYPGTGRGDWDNSGVKVYVLDGAEMKLKQDFGKETVQAVLRAKPPILSRQRLYVNPVNEKLYVAEGDAGVMKSCGQLLEIDPGTGKLRFIDVPFDAEDFCFDLNGLIYMRTDHEVGRFDFRSWREVPWDYGEERPPVGFSASGDGRRAPLVSALSIPGNRPVCWHAGGMSISARGKLAVSCCNFEQPPSRQDRKWTSVQAGKPYTPQIFPGRTRWQETHVWDEHGKLVYEDAVSGLGRIDGLAIDKDNHLYAMAGVARVSDGKRYFNDMSETLMKFGPGKARIICGSGGSVPLPEESRPKRSPDLAGAWVVDEGAEWFYGGVGFGGFNAGRAGGGCACWNVRFALDYFERSFAPEIEHFSVAVLDGNGNLIVRVGQYGNVDSAGPKSLVPLGGDEVGLFHAAYVATHTDRRLFIADGGNQRIVSVKLGYHAEEKVALKDVPDQGKK
jgi:hypothetical protein